MIRLESTITNTPIRSHSINTPSILAQIRHSSTFVNILTIHRYPTFQTHRLIFLRVFWGANLTMGSPSFSHGATTTSSCHMLHIVSMRITSSMDQLTETEPNSSINTRLSIVGWFEAFVTITSVASLEVHAAAILAEATVDGAFVDISAIVGHADLLVAFWTDAHERANEVLAEKLAVVCGCGAFIHVYTVFSVGS